MACEQLCDYCPYEKQPPGLTGLADNSVWGCAGRFHWKGIFVFGKKTHKSTKRFRPAGYGCPRDFYWHFFLLVFALALSCGSPGVALQHIVFGGGAAEGLIKKPGSGRTDSVAPLVEGFTDLLMVIGVVIFMFL